MVADTEEANVVLDEVAIIKQLNSLLALHFQQVVM